MEFASIQRDLDDSGWGLYRCTEHIGNEALVNRPHDGHPNYDTPEVLHVAYTSTETNAPQ